METPQRSFLDGTRGLYLTIIPSLFLIAGVFVLLILMIMNAEQAEDRAEADRDSIHAQQLTITALLDPPALTVQTIEVLNRVEGVDGPAVIQGDVIRWSQIVCNPRDGELSSTIGGALTNIDTGETISFAETASASLPKGCQTSECICAIRMDRVVTPGQWRLRLQIFFTGLSESFFGFSPPLEVVADDLLVVPR